MSPDDRETIAFWGGLLGVVLAFVLFIWLVASCASTTQPRQGVSVDPCDACHKSCNDAGGQIEAWQCVEGCVVFCAMLRDGGA
jgi:hypothetical protein